MYAVFMLLWALLITPLSMRLFVVWHGLSSLPGGHFLLRVSGLRTLVFWQLQIHLPTHQHEYIKFLFLSMLLLTNLSVHLSPLQ